MMMENGHPGVEVDEAAIRRGENPYTKYYQQQGEQQLPSDTQVSITSIYNPRRNMLTFRCQAATFTIPVNPPLIARSYEFDAFETF